MKKFFFIIFIVLFHDFALNQSYAAMLIADNGVPVKKNDVSTNLWDAVQNFESNSVPVIDASGTLLQDIFIDEQTVKAFGVYVENDLFIPDNETAIRLIYKDLKFNKCPKIITYEQIKPVTQSIICGIQPYFSLKNLLKTILNQYVNDEMNSKSFLSGEFSRKWGLSNYKIKFEFQIVDLQSRKSALDYLLKLEEDQRLDNIRMDQLARDEAAKQEAQKRDEVAKQEAQKRDDEIIKNQLAINTIAKQAIMIDGTLAIRVESVAHLLDLTIAKGSVSPNCIIIKEVQIDEPTVLCEEIAWKTTNLVSKIVFNQMYSPLIIVNDIFKDITLTYSSSSRELKLKYNLRNLEFKSLLPVKLPLVKSTTRAQIFPYTKDSVPKCSTSTLKRNAYTLSLTGSRPYKSIDLNLKNTSNSTIVVIWDETSLRLPDGSSSGVIHGGTRFSDRSLGQANTPVSPRALLQDLLVAKTSIKYSESLADWVFDLFSISVIFNETRNSLFVRGSTQTVSGSIALQVNGKRVFEQFSVTCKAKTGEFRA